MTQEESYKIINDYFQDLCITPEILSNFIPHKKECDTKHSIYEVCNDNDELFTEEDYDK